jgi:hypothetical protein
MLRNGLVALLGCLYVALSIWIVGQQGQSYRDGLRRERLRARESEKPARPTESRQVKLADVVPGSASGPDPAPSAAPLRPVAGAITAAPAPTAPAAPPITAAAAPVAPAATMRVPDKTRTPPPAAGPSKPNPAAAPIADRTADRPPAATAAPVDPLADKPFWNQPQLTKNWELADLSTTDERKLGADLHELIVQLNPVASDGSWLKRVEDVAKPLLQNRLRKEITYKFTILDSDEVNAFSHPGGYVYLNRGLFDLIGEDEDYALQFAVGHEIAHVDLAHAIKCLQDPDITKMNGGTLRKLYWVIIPFGYLVSETVNQDYEADEWVASRMRNLGRSRRETLAFLNKLDGYATRHGFRDGQAKVRLAPDSSLIDIRYRRQTAAWRRLDHLNERIK